MASRVLSAFIVCFWLVMTTLLVRLEIDPGNSNLLTVPPAHVFKLMFQHEQISDLTILDNGKPIGTLMLHPKNGAGANDRSLVFSGGFSTTLPGSNAKQRIICDGILDMNRNFDPLALQLNISLQEPAYSLHANVDFASKHADYQITQGKHIFRKSTITLDQAGLNSLLRDELGVDPSIIQNVQNAPMNVGHPTIAARQTLLTIRKERVTAYQITFNQGETTLAEVYVSPLGQVLSAKTLPGYTFSAEDMMASQ